MLDVQVRDLTDRLIQVDFNDRRTLLQRGVREIAERMNARGILHSSIHVDEVVLLCQEEVEIRASIVVQAHTNVLTKLGMGPSSELAADLKQRLRYYLPLHDDYVLIPESLESQLGLMRPLNIRARIASAWEHAIQRQDAQIDLIVLSTSKRAERLDSGSSLPTSATNNYFYAPVASFQTGAGSIAAVNQTISFGDRDALVKALDLVREAIQHEQKIDTFNKGEVIELIDEGKAEIAKSKPNGTKLGSIMQTVSAAIQTVATLKSAYQTLKSALAPFGIQLP